MLWTVISLLMTAFLYFILGIRGNKWQRSKRQWLALCGLLIIFFGCVTSIPTGHTGIVTTFGRVEDSTLEAGVHFKTPWQEIVKMDNRNQKSTVELQCFSSDIQEVEVIYTINYQIEKANAQTIYKTIGTEYLNTVVTPRIQEAVKSVIAKYNAENLIANREILSTEIRNILLTKLANYNIEILDASIENLDFSDVFTNAVEAKQVAEQNKLKAAIEQEQAVIEAEAKAEREIIDANAKSQVAKIAAEAELNVVKTKADGNEYAGQKESSKNEALASTLTTDLLYYYYIQQWGGELPDTYISQEDFAALFGINISNSNPAPDPTPGSGE